jgi:hypothetical protein
MIVSVKFFNHVFVFVSKQDYLVKKSFYSSNKKPPFSFPELLRKTSEHVLIDMVQLLFARLPQFKDDVTPSTLTKRVKQNQ